MTWFKWNDHTVQLLLICIFLACFKIFLHQAVNNQKVDRMFECPSPPPSQKVYILPHWAKVIHPEVNFNWIPFRTVPANAHPPDSHHKFNLVSDWREPGTDNTGVIIQPNLSSSPWSMFRLRGDKESLTHRDLQRGREGWRREGWAGIPRVDGTIWWGTSRDFVQLPQGHEEENTCVPTLHQPTCTVYFILGGCNTWHTVPSDMLLPCNDPLKKKKADMTWQLILKHRVNAWWALMDPFMEMWLLMRSVKQQMLLKMRAVSLTWPDCPLC